MKDTTPDIPDNIVERALDAYDEIEDTGSYRIKAMRAALRIAVDWALEEAANVVSDARALSQTKT
jgi:hypothetical protein